MDWTERQILETLRLIEDSDFDEVRLEGPNFRLHVSKAGGPAALAAPGARDLAGHAAPRQAAVPVQPEAVRADSEQAAVPEGLVAVRAPMIGTFYRAPAPHLAPFVEVGASVGPEDTVCLVEVMKLFNTIRAGAAGRVVKILAQNAAMVQRDQVLMLIEPS